MMSEQIVNLVFVIVFAVLLIVGLIYLTILLCCEIKESREKANYYKKLYEAIKEGKQ